LSATCTVCHNPAARALIDGALVAGERPMHVHRDYGDALGLSLSAVYRHARSHVRSHLVPEYVGNVTSGELLADQAALARSLYAQHVAATEAGHHAAAARFGAEAGRVLRDLLSEGFDTEDDAQRRRDLEEAGSTLGKLMYLHRDVLPQAEQVARSLGFARLADEIRDDMPALFAARDAKKE
jgi:hypothetical protein